MAMNAPTIPGRLFEQAKLRPTAPALHTKVGDEWLPTSWKGYAENTRSVARAMLAMELKTGDVVCILGNNRSEWVEADIAAMAIGAIPAGIYQTCSPEEIHYILEHSEAPIVIVENQDQWDKVAQIRDRLPALKTIVTMRGTQITDDQTQTWDDFVASGSGVVPQDVDDRVAELKPGQAATFIYTSGTTGPPKAVMLSHENLAWTANKAVSLVDHSTEDCGLSYLPLSHIAEQMFSIHAPITAGGQVYFAESVAKMPDNIKEVQPTIFFGVPRVWEKFHAGVAAKLKLATGVKAGLVSFARDAGTRSSEARCKGEELSTIHMLRYRLANKLVLSKLKPALGLGRARICVSGAAPIAPDVLEFMASLDIVVHEVYGQSEDTGPTTFNLPGITEFGTVGQRIDGIEVKIAEDGEILVRGPNVFMGYYKDEAATTEALDSEGWLHSGDLGSFSSSGYLTITGRKKDIIITAGGKNIAPKNIEAGLMEHELISQAVVIGDRRKFLSALVGLDPEAAERFLQEKNMGEMEVAGHPAIEKEVQAHVDHVNTRFARVEHIRKFTVLPRELDQENGELTPTLKIKRTIVNEVWSDAIESMYAD
jgi:long-chain acyl-CoA synthetase